MKTYIRRYGRVWLAVFLMSAIVLQMFYGVGLGSEAANAEYTEMQFTDWGIKVTDSTQTSGWDIYSLTDDDAIASLDGVAINGLVDFNGGQFGNAMLTFGATDSALSGGVWLCSDGTQFNYCVQGIGTNTDPWNYINSPMYQSDGSMELRLTFDKAVDANDWTVNVYISEELVGTMVFSNVDPGLYLGISPNVSIAADREYTEMHFADWGIKVADSAQTGGWDIYSLANSSGVTSLDGVAISGLVDFNGGQFGNAMLTFGATDSALSGGVWLCSDGTQFNYCVQGIGTNTDPWNYINSPMYQSDGSMELRLTFDKAADADDWAVNVYISGELVGTMIFSDVNPGMYLGVSPNVTITDELHYGLGEPVSNLGVGEVPYASSEFVTSLVGAFGVDTFRIWLPCVGRATSNVDGTYDVSLEPTMLAELKELVVRLQLNGVRQILALPYPIIPDNFPKYVGKDGNQYTQQDLDNGNVTNDALVRMDYYAFPTHGTNAYDTFMDLQTEYFKLLAEEVPEITHYEGINEPENPYTNIIHKMGYLEDSERVLLENPSAYPANSYYEYDVAEIAKITVDFCHAITDGIEEAGADAKVLSSGLTVIADSYDYLVEAYKYIKYTTDNHYKDNDPNNYFEIVNWHPYVFGNNENNSEMADNVVPGTNWGKDYWGPQWIAFQEKLYSVVNIHHGPDVPVWLTELGQSDWGANYHITSLEAALRIQEMIELVETNLPFVDTIIGFRLFDKLDSEQETDEADAGEDNYGMLEDINNVASGTLALKENGKTFYRIVKGTDDYGVVTTIVDKYYGIYLGTYELDRSDDFESAVVKGNTFVTNHSDVKVTYSTYKGYMHPTLSLVTDDDNQMLAFDYSADAAITKQAHIRFDLGRLKTGVYTFEFDIDTKSLDGKGTSEDVLFGVTTSQYNSNWATQTIQTDKDGTEGIGIVRYSWGATPVLAENKITFTVSETLEDVAIVFQTGGVGGFRISFDNIELTKIN